MHDDLQNAQEAGLFALEPASSNAGGTRTPKFRNPEKPAETWMGRGKRPNWLKAQLAAGRSLNDFRVND